MDMYILGCIAALMSASFWAFGSILFKNLGNHASSLGINLSKSIVATICLWVLLLFVNSESVSHSTFFYLGVSGLLGITLGDTFYFKSLFELGPRLSLTLTLLIPVTTVLLAVVILQEVLSSTQLIGIIVTLSGVFWVLTERSASAGYNVQNKIKGTVYGILAVFSCAFSIIFSKLAVESIGALKATFVRQCWGTAGLIFF